MDLQSKGYLIHNNCILQSYDTVYYNMTYVVTCCNILDECLFIILRFHHSHNTSPSTAGPNQWPAEPPSLKPLMLRWLGHPRMELGRRLGGGWAIRRLPRRFKVKTCSGWWFGTSALLVQILGVSHHPNWHQLTYIFQRGGATTQL